MAGTPAASRGWGCVSGGEARATTGLFNIIFQGGAEGEGGGRDERRERGR